MARLYEFQKLPMDKKDLEIIKNTIDETLKKIGINKSKTKLNIELKNEVIHIKGYNLR